MIPRAVELTDFLSHRTPNGTPIVFDFDGAVLWSVAGDNGAGKSAIFDAITWTLYGQHRGGTQDAQRLISHGAQSARAAFEFALGGTCYRVERSIRRRGAVRRVAQRWDERAQRWEELPDTTGETGFARWREGLLGLSYEAFTHAVLLIQGGSDRLVASGARERFEILAQLVDLSSYRRLEERARERAAAARGRRSALAGELELLPAVDPKERAAAQAERKRLAAVRERAKGEWEAHVAVLEGARAHAGLRARLAEIEQEIGDAEALLADVARIRAQAGEWAALRAARPHLDAGLAALAVAAQARAAADDAGERAQAIDLAALRRAAAAARRGAARAQRAAAQSGERAGTLRRLLPLLETALQRRLEQLDAEEAAAAIGASPAAAAAAIEQAQASLAELTAARERARRAERRGERAAARAAAAVQAAEAALRQYHEGERELVCARCGQQVPAEHRATHLAHLEQELAERRAAQADAQAALTPLAAARATADAALERAQAIAAELARVHERALAAEQAVERAAAAAASAREALGAWSDRRARLLAAGTRDELTALRDALRTESAAADREEEERGAAAGDAETAARAAREQADAAVQARGTLELERRQQQQTAAAEARRAAIELRQVPAAWARRARAGEAALLAALDARVEALAPAVQQAAELERAEQTLAAQRAAHAEVAARIAAVPPAHAVTVSAAEAQLARRTKAFDAASARHQQAQARLRELDRRARELRGRRAELEQATLEERRAARLATLLGRQGIQGHLIVRAARGLERLANETLRALTGGALELEISAEERRGRDEIVISARDFNAGGESTDASFLSGSEKFRVCVAMAAAIGKYASGRIAIESLIVDEGFGSLDEASRDEMIEELQRLAALLQRVIVVSHQAEFQDRARFPHGYRLRRDHGATTVERFV